ncbi:MAG: exodeoxyribonuclease III [Pseudomonadota bacterium]|nr:exodeoxyribonuclease III [Pseudomonadota bacterium]
MIRVITTNLNGIRSAQRKGFHEWVLAQAADFVCVQEIKATDADIPDEMRRIGELEGHFHAAEKRGYSGVGIYCRRPPERLVAGFGDEEFDAEGRYLEAIYGDLAVVSLYLPSGSSSPDRQEAKYRFMERFLVHLGRLRERGLEVIVCGDWNIAHKEIDLRNWKSNQKNSGFLPEERAWLTRVFDELGFVDVFRRLDDRPERYTWWSNRGQAWAKNVGWRLDYQIATPGIAARASACDIYVAARFSDHAPLTIDYAAGP